MKYNELQEYNIKLTAPSRIEIGFVDQKSSLANPEVHATKKIQPGKQVRSPVVIFACPSAPSARLV